RSSLLRTASICDPRHAYRPDLWRWHACRARSHVDPFAYAGSTPGRPGHSPVFHGCSGTWLVEPITVGNWAGQPSTGTRMIPDDIQDDVRYTKTRGGDGFGCELALDYLDETKNPPEQITKRHRWTLTASQLAEAAGNEQLLEDDTRARYSENF